MKAFDVKDRTFELATIDDPIISESGVYIRLIEVDNWLYPMIQIGEDTTDKDIKEAIPLAFDWRNRLLEIQGIRVSWGETGFWESLSRKHEWGESYEQIAKGINQEVSEYLCEYSEFVKEFLSVRHKLKTKQDQVLWETSDERKGKGHSLSLGYAKQVLRRINPTGTKKVAQRDAIIDKMVREGLVRIKNGEAPFAEGYPVSRDRVKDALRNWRKGKKHKIQKIKDNEE